MLRRVAFVRTDVSEEHSASFIRVTTSVLTRVTRRNIPENAILLSHGRENLKFYNSTTLYGFTSSEIVLNHWGNINFRTNSQYAVRRHCHDAHIERLGEMVQRYYAASSRNGKETLRMPRQ
jgi:hypothetical protein